MNVEHWREQLSALDFMRDCSAPTSEDSCWLCEDLVAWNTVLHPLKLRLAEQTPGVLCLCTISYKTKTSADFEELDTPYSATFFTVWLPKKHRCVEEIELYGSFLRFDTVAIPDSLARSPSNLRCVSIEAGAELDWDMLFDALDPIEHVEELQLGDLTVTDSLNSKLAQLLLTNADSIKVVDLFGIYFSCSSANIFVSSISKCEKLKELSFHANLSSDGLKDFTTLLRSTETLEKLSLVEEQQNYGVSDEKYDEEILATVGDLLRRNTTLTELRFRGHRHLLIDILNALETNCVLRCLAIDTYDTDWADPGHMFAKALKFMLARNKGLRSLCLVDFDIDYHTGGLMSEGLQTNTTLECLDMSGSIVCFLALYALCKLMRVNRTLSSLQVGYFRADKSESILLSRELAKLSCYRRVQMAWHHWDTPGLSSALLDSSLCPTELTLDTLLFPEEAFSAICDAVALSVGLEELTVDFSSGDGAHVESLCKALGENKSLRHVTLNENVTSLHAAATAARSLCVNKTVNHLEVSCDSIDETSAGMFASLLAANDSIQRLQILSKVKLTPVCKDMLSRAFAQNQFITYGSILDGRGLENSCSETVQAVLQRNITHLHRAARFVLRKNTEKACAEAFELFRSKSHLLGCVMSASGMSKTEAKAAVKAAGSFLRSNYLFINRVVCHKVECHAGEGTQIDQLTHECWVAVTKYLKVSDIAGE